MSSVIQDNPQNPRVGCVSSSKFPPCSPVINNLRFDGYSCTFATAGEAIPAGAVLRPSTTVDRQVVQTTGPADEAVLGVAVESATAGSRVCMAVGGEFQVLVTGAVTRADFLASSATVGVAVSTGTDGSEGDFAIATNSDASGAVKLVFARFKKAEVF